MLKFALAQHVSNQVREIERDTSLRVKGRRILASHVVGLLRPAGVQTFVIWVYIEHHATKSVVG